MGAGWAHSPGLPPSSTRTPFQKRARADFNLRQDQRGGWLPFSLVGLSWRRIQVRAVSRDPVTHVMTSNTPVSQDAGDWRKMRRCGDNQQQRHRINSQTYQEENREGSWWIPSRLTRSHPPRPQRRSPRANPPIPRPPTPLPTYIGACAVPRRRYGVFAKGKDRKCPRSPEG